MFDSQQISGGPFSQTSPFDDSQWSVTTGKQNTTAGGAKTGQPSLMDAFTPVATATYGAGGGSASGASSMQSMVPVLLIGGVLVVILVLVKHKHKG
jgi:hypothetical protein